MRAITARHLNRYLDLLTGIAARTGAADPDVLGRQLLMPVEGATIVAAHRRPADTAGQARHAALTLATSSTSWRRWDAQCRPTPAA